MLFSIHNPDRSGQRALRLHAGQSIHQYSQPFILIDKRSNKVSLYAYIHVYSISEMTCTGYWMRNLMVPVDIRFPLIVLVLVFARVPLRLLSAVKNSQCGSEALWKSCQLSGLVSLHMPMICR